jgi:hypothetical protein
MSIPPGAIVLSSGVSKLERAVKWITPGLAAVAEVSSILCRSILPARDLIIGFRSRKQSEPLVAGLIATSALSMTTISLFAAVSKSQLLARKIALSGDCGFRYRRQVSLAFLNYGKGQKLKMNHRSLAGSVTISPFIQRRSISRRVCICVVGDSDRSSSLNPPITRLPSNNGKVSLLSGSRRSPRHCHSTLDRPPLLVANNKAVVMG